LPAIFISIITPASSLFSFSSSITLRFSPIDTPPLPTPLMLTLFSHTDDIG